MGLIRVARDAVIQARLERWAEGVLCGDGSGFPTKSVLHLSWSPPTPGLSPVLKVAPGSDVAQTHRMIGKLSERLIATVVVHYVLRPPIEEQAAMLECEPATVYARIERIHAEMQRMLCEIQFSRI